MSGGRIETRPVGSDALDDLAALFLGCRNTRRCWCMAFCSSRSQFAVGWLTGGNRRRFDRAVHAAGLPMGVLATLAREPVGWCACGPRSRYAGAERRRRPLLADRDPAEDESVWFVPCLFVRADQRGHGVAHVLLRSAVELARASGAVAVEGWPITGSDRGSPDAFLGRESLFEQLGFRRVALPAHDRALVRLGLTSHE